MQNKTLYLFTQSFPYTKAAEQTFLQNEIPYLLKIFKKVVIIPEHTEGGRVNLDSRVKIDETLSLFIKKKRIHPLKRCVLGFTIRLFINEFTNNPAIILSPEKLYRLVLSLYRIKVVKEWLSKENFDKDDSVFYTYWFTDTTVALSSIFNKVLTRAHGSDLYEERHNNYIPLREFTLSKIYRVYCVSQAGADYLIQKYPDYKEKISLARIGIKGTINDFTEQKRSDIFRIVSCSSLIPLKRVDLILKAVIEFSDKYPNQKIEYIHFGDGPELNKINDVIASIKNSNLSVKFPGNTDNKIIMAYYTDNFIDVFINASTTEGIPVSIMEAQSFGIPFIATKVGGIPEMASNGNRIIVSANPNSNEIAEKIAKIYEMDNNELIKLRENSFLNWKLNFNSDTNFSKFAEEISRI